MLIKDIFFKHFLSMTFVYIQDFRSVEGNIRFSFKINLFVKIMYNYDMLVKQTFSLPRKQSKVSS